MPNIVIHQQHDLFIKQDIKEGFFDVTFKIEDRLLHAHRFVLVSASSTFKTMFSERWEKSEPIQIKAYSFTTFKEFLSYFYRGTCDLNESNIFTIIDLAEMYGIEDLKQKCDDYLMNVKFHEGNVLKFCEMIEIYRFEKMKAPLGKYVAANLAILLKKPEFMSASENVILGLLKLKRKNYMESMIFEKLFQWVKNSVNKEAQQKSEAFDEATQNQMICERIAKFLPLIKFKKMPLEFLHAFVVPRGYIFSSFTELANVLLKASKPQVAGYQEISITDWSGHFILNGKLLALPEEINAIVSIIKLLPQSNGYSVTGALPKPLKISRSLIDLNRNAIDVPHTAQNYSTVSYRGHSSTHASNYYNLCYLVVPRNRLNIITVISAKHLSDDISNYYVLAELFGKIPNLPLANFIISFPSA